MQKAREVVIVMVFRVLEMIKTSIKHLNELYIHVYRIVTKLAHYVRYLKSINSYTD